MAYTKIMEVLLILTNRNQNRRATSTSSQSMRISTDELLHIQDRLKGQTCCRSTRLNYHAICTLFIEFHIQPDKKPEKWGDRISLFATHLVKTKHQSPTVKSYCSAVKTILRQEIVHVEENNYILYTLVKACKMQNDRLYMIRMPIQKRLLAMILEQIEKSFLAKNLILAVHHNGLNWLLWVT